MYFRLKALSVPRSTRIFKIPRQGTSFSWIKKFVLWKIYLALKSESSLNVLCFCGCWCPNRTWQLPMGACPPAQLSPIFPCTPRQIKLSYYHERVSHRVPGLCAGALNTQVSEQQLKMCFERNRCQWSHSSRCPTHPTPPELMWWHAAPTCQALRSLVVFLSTVMQCCSLLTPACHNPSAAVAHAAPESRRG